MHTHSLKTRALTLSAIFATTAAFSPLSAFALENSAPAITSTSVIHGIAGMTDVTENMIYKDGIEFLLSQKIVSGYPDGTYKPLNTLNRAEMLKILVGATTKVSLETYKTKSCFDDVPANEWFTPYVCYGKEKGWVIGYDNGKNFRPAQTVNTVEALKMTLQAFGISYIPTDDIWYKGIVEAASSQNIIPQDVMSFDAGLRRNQMADLIARVLLKKESKLSDYLKDAASIVVTFDTIKAGKNLAAEASIKAAEEMIKKAAEDAKKAAETKKAEEAAKAAAEKEAAAKAEEEAQTPGEPFIAITPFSDTSVMVEVYEPYKDGESPIEYYIVEQLVEGIYKPLTISYKKDQALSSFQLSGLIKNKTYTLKFTAVNKYNKKSKGETTFTILFGNTNTYPFFVSDVTEPGKPVLYVTKQDAGTITLTLEAPTETGGSPVTGYLMRKKEDGKYAPYKFLAFDSKGNGQYIFANLDPALLYTYEFKTVTQNREISDALNIEFMAKKGGSIQTF